MEESFAALCTSGDSKRPTYICCVNELLQSALLHTGSSEIYLRGFRFDNNLVWGRVSVVQAGQTTARPIPQPCPLFHR